LKDIFARVPPHLLIHAQNRQRRSRRDRSDAVHPQKPFARWIHGGKRTDSSLRVHWRFFYTQEFQADIVKGGWINCVEHWKGQSGFGLKCFDLLIDWELGWSNFTEICNVMWNYPEFESFTIAVCLKKFTEKRVTMREPMKWRIQSCLRKSWSLIWGQFTNHDLKNSSAMNNIIVFAERNPNGNNE
jgi:hypothetical protein